MHVNKRCSTCTKLRPLEDYVRNRSKRHGRDNECRGCKRARSIAKKFGITPEQYEALLKHQGDACAICEQPEKTRRLSVDHDHVTGDVRGLLCGKCNTALGLLKDRPFLIVRAAGYLLGHREKKE